MKRIMWINVAVGFWLIIAGFTQQSEMLRGIKMVNEFAAGLLLMGCAFWFMDTVASQWLPFACSLVIGAWLVVVPFLMRYSSWNDVVCGVIAILVTLAAAQGVRRESPV